MLLQACGIPCLCVYVGEWEAAQSVWVYIFNSQVSVHDPCQLSYGQPQPIQGGLWISHFTNMMNVTCSVMRSKNHIVLPSCDTWWRCHFTGKWKYTGFIPVNESWEWSAWRWYSFFASDWPRFFNIRFYLLLLRLQTMSSCGVTKYENGLLKGNF